MTETINVGGISKDMTAGEIAELKEWQAGAEEDDKKYKAYIEKIEKDRSSGNKKLKDLGLTDDEITALMG
tara:strand:- start:61 stop:270 length:210 start_codon:yes stop_codon:yes gene_type:complete